MASFSPARSMLTASSQDTGQMRPTMGTNQGKKGKSQARTKGVMAHSYSREEL
jgi:hypothetical protein